MPLLSQPAIKAAHAAENGIDLYLRYVLCAITVLLGLYYAFPALTATGIVLAVLPLSTLLLWTTWVTILALSFLAIVLSLLFLLPTQVLPGQGLHSEVRLPCLVMAVLLQGLNDSMSALNPMLSLDWQQGLSIDGGGWAHFYRSV